MFQISAKLECRYCDEVLAIFQFDLYDQRKKLNRDICYIAKHVIQANLIRVHNVVSQ